MTVLKLITIVSVIKIRGVTEEKILCVASGRKAISVMGETQPSPAARGHTRRPRLNYLHPTLATERTSIVVTCL